MTRFRDLRVGQTFDFVKDGSRFNSFFNRVEKISGRKYRDVEGSLTYRVGTVDVEVYHVDEEYQPPQAEIDAIVKYMGFSREVATQMLRNEVYNDMADAQAYDAQWR